MRCIYPWPAMLVGALMLCLIVVGCNYLTPPTVAASGPEISISQPSSEDTSAHTKRKRWRIIVRRAGKPAEVIDDDRGGATE